VLKGDYMAFVRVEIDGLNQIVDELSKMPDGGKKALHNAVNKGAEYLHPKIRASIERGNSKDGKHLKDAIKVRKAKPKKKTMQSADVVGGKGTTVDYGFHVETGTRKTKGKSFMRQTTDANAETVANIVMDEIEKGLGV
jgi:HK97 gp10 family phage protein